MVRITIIICKLIKKWAKKLGRGSSFPGKVALKLCPNILSRITLPEITIAVTGSNGKTTTVEMINSLLVKQGYSVAYNYEGSNQIEGVTTLILDNCDNDGKFLKDVLLMEVDERYARYIFKFFAPKYYVINNLYRDQMTRNGHPEYVLKAIADSIRPESTLILNGDDPLIASLAEKFENKAIYFGIYDNEYTSEECDSVYDDGYYCPVCHHRMTYDYRQFAHVGAYHCLNCGFQRKDPEYHISKLDLESGELVINNRYRITMALKTIYNAYNTVAAFALGSLLGLDKKYLREDLNNFMIKNGRVRRFKTGRLEGTLLISKHENTMSYNRNLDYVAGREENVILLLIIDDISRKYFTSDTSWLWDISFDKLNSANITEIVTAGKYEYDIAVRFEYAGVNMDKVVMYRSVPEAIAYLRNKPKGILYCMTCFSDQDKLLNEVEVLN